MSAIDHKPPATRRFAGFREFRRAPHRAMLDLTREHGDLVLLRGFADIHLLNHPDFIRPVLSGSHDLYTKGTLGYRVVAKTLGKGLVTNDGPDWVRQRRLIQPSFSHRNIQSFDRIIGGLTDAMLRDWELRADGEAVRIDEEMSALTFRIVGETVFGRNIEHHAREVRDVLDIVNVDPLGYRGLLTLAPWIPTPHNIRFLRARRRLDRVVYGIIAAREEAGPTGDDMLARLMRARDEDTDTGMTGRQLRDEVVTLMLAGHETSATALSWTLYLLGMHPEVEAELLDHLDSGLGGEPPLAEDLARVPYLKQVVQEAMRLYPPAWGFARRAEEPQEFRGYRLPKNSYLFICPYALHRHPDFWPDAERFDPGRFHPDRSSERDFFSYLPFGAGPRTCIGAGMAMLEIQIVLARILQRFRVRLVPDHPVEAVAKVTLCPKFGIAATLARR